MRRHSTFPMVQGCRLRFEFVPQRPISTSTHHEPVECRQRTLRTPHGIAFLYPRFRPSTNRNSIPVPSKQLRQLSYHTTLPAPYSQLRITPYFTIQWNFASHSTRNFSRHPRDFGILKTIRTMPDPVPRTASPYVDPTVKGPRSQQLSSGQGHSLLQDHKS